MDIDRKHKLTSLCSSILNRGKKNFPQCACFSIFLSPFISSHHINVVCARRQTNAKNDPRQYLLFSFYSPIPLTTGVVCYQDELVNNKRRHCFRRLHTSLLPFTFRLRNKYYLWSLPLNHFTPFLSLSFSLFSLTQIYSHFHERVY